jgi:hypothetical protein
MTPRQPVEGAASTSRCQFQPRRVPGENEKRAQIVQPLLSMRRGFLFARPGALRRGDAICRNSELWKNTTVS